MTAWQSWTDGVLTEKAICLAVRLGRLLLPTCLCCTALLRSLLEKRSAPHRSAYSQCAVVLVQKVCGLFMCT